MTARDEEEVHTRGTTHAGALCILTYIRGKERGREGGKGDKGKRGTAHTGFSHRDAYQIGLQTLVD